MQWTQALPATMTSTARTASRKSKAAVTVAQQVSACCESVSCHVSRQTSVSKCEPDICWRFLVQALRTGTRLAEAASCCVQVVRITKTSMDVYRDLQPSCLNPSKRKRRWTASTAWGRDGAEQLWAWRPPTSLLFSYFFCNRDWVLLRILTQRSSAQYLTAAVVSEKWTPEAHRLPHQWGSAVKGPDLHEWNILHFSEVVFHGQQERIQQEEEQGEQNTVQ